MKYIPKSERERTYYIDSCNFSKTLLSNSRVISKNVRITPRPSNSRISEPYFVKIKSKIIPTFFFNSKEENPPKNVYNCARALNFYLIDKNT